MKDLALALGLSVSTVSRVLSGQAEQNRIAPATRARILASAAQLGVIVDQQARGLRLRQTLTIGLVIPDIANPFFASFACAVEKVARAAGYTVLLCDSQETTAIEAEAVHLLQARRVDGMILAPVGETHDHLLPVQRAGIPLVLADRVFPQWDVPSVVVDNFGGARLAVNHLLACGHRRIGCVQGLPASYPNRERLRGYQDGLREAGIPFDPHLLSGSDFTAEGGYRAALELCRNPQAQPTALFALGSLLALGALRAIHESGLAVPLDISVVAFDEQPWAEFLSPSLTTVAQPVEALATESFANLLNAMRPSSP
ncbi:MAG: LacI family DNA-binding transcriptional regulator, partial [Verrucomicrobiota bacterium]